MRSRQFLDGVLGSLLVSSAFYLLAADPDERWTWLGAMTDWPWHLILGAGWIVALCGAWISLSHAGPDPYPDRIARRVHRGWWALQVPVVFLVTDMSIQDGCWAMSANVVGSAGLACAWVGALRLDGRESARPMGNLAAWTGRIPPSNAVQRSPDGPVIGALMGLGLIFAAVVLCALVSAAAIENRPGAPDGKAPPRTTVAEPREDPGRARSADTTSPGATTSVPEAEPAVPVTGPADLTG